MKWILEIKEGMSILSSKYAYIALYTQNRALNGSGPTSNIPGIDATLPCRLIATTGARIILSSGIVIDNAAQTFLVFVPPRCTTIQNQ